MTSLVYFGYCIVRTLSINGFWLLLWYILVIALSILRLFTASDYSFGIFCPLYCPYFVNLRLLITFLEYFGHCIVITSSIYGFWLLLWNTLIIVFPYFVYLRLLITPLVYFGLYIVCTSSIYSFWLLLWYILVIILSVLRLFTASHYFFGIFWSLYCPYFVYLRLLITPLVYFGHCIVCSSSIYCFWLLLCYILVIVLCVRHLFTAYDYFFGMFWSLYCLYVVYLRLITPLVYFGHCIVRTSSIYAFWLLLWYNLSIVFSALRQFTSSDYFFGIFWLLYIRTSSIYGFWLLLWYIVVTILSVCRLFASSDYPFDIFWSLYSPYVVYIRLLITSLAYFGHCIVGTSSINGFWLPLWYIVVIVLSVLRLFTASDYSFGIFCHCIVRTSSIYGFWLLHWYILVIALSVFRLFTAFDYSFGIFWSLYCLYFVNLRLLITSLVYFGHCIVIPSSIYGFWLLLWYNLSIVFSALRQFTTSDYFFGIFWLLYIRTSSIYGFWLLLWYILVIRLSVCRLFSSSDYPFNIFWSLYSPYFVYIRLLITSLAYFGHCIVGTSSINGFWLSLWYIVVIVLFVLRLFTASDYSFGILWSLYCPYFVYLWLLITSLVYLVIALSVLRQFTASDYFFGIFWSLYCPCVGNLRLLITSFVYFDYCISVLRLFTDSDYYFGIFWSLYCLYVVYLRLLIIPLVSFGHCIVRTSSIYGFWLLLWYILVIVLSLRRLFTASDYSFGIFWSLYFHYVVYLRLLITHLV